MKPNIIPSFQNVFFLSVLFGVSKAVIGFQLGSFLFHGGSATAKQSCCQQNEKHSVMVFLFHPPFLL